MASLARVVRSVFLSLVTVSLLWGCGNSSSNGNQDAAVVSPKMDSALGTSRDLPVGTAYDSSPELDSLATVDLPQSGIDALVSAEVGALDLGSGTSKDVALSDLPSRDLPVVDAPSTGDLPSSGSLDLSGAPDSPGGDDVPMSPGTGGSAGSGGAAGGTGAGGSGGVAGAGGSNGVLSHRP